jgi:glyoxylase-like metal-dependent hydrolase (beta-lactamase superfamily II)
MGLQALPIPGAVAGETAYLTPEGYLFLGDAVINLESHGLALLPDKYCRDPRQNRLSLKTLLDYEFSIVTFAHGLPLRQQAKERLRALLEEG